MGRFDIQIDGNLLEKLSESFFWQQYRERPKPPPLKDGEVLAAALIVARVTGLVVKIFADEHPPPHFHVSYQGKEASFSITECKRLLGTTGLERFETTIRAWWEENQPMLIEKWNSSRPSDCPVGPIIVHNQVH